MVIMAARNIVAQKTPLPPSKLSIRANSNQKGREKLINHEEQLMTRDETNFHQEALP
jgi:hypothetical protein